MIDFRCSHCNKLLGKIEGEAEIKCPKCKTMNVTEGLFNRKLTHATHQKYANMLNNGFEAQHKY